MNTVGTNTDIVIQPLTASSFAPFGEVIEVSGSPSATINRGICHRYHDLASLDIVDGRAGVSLFDTSACSLPYCLDMVERHPHGSQAFIAMSCTAFLIIAAEDENDCPVRPRAWLTNGAQGVNFHRGTWHGVLTALHEPALFAVIDRIGDGANLEEFAFNPPYRVVDANQLVSLHSPSSGHHE